jgi:hypothetical protein
VSGRNVGACDGAPVALHVRMDELDLAAKALMRVAPAAFARLALGAGARIRTAAAVNVELPALGRRVDTLLRVQLEGERRRVLAHVEVAASWRSNLPRRVYEYATLLRRAGDRVESVVVCLKPGRKQGRPVGCYLERGRTNTTRFTFPVVCLWRVRARDLRAMGRAFLPFVPYASDATVALVERTMRALDSVAPIERRADLQAALAVFAGNVFVAIDWRTRIPREVLVQNTFIKAVKQEGAHEGRQRLLASQLRIRLGPAARKYVKRLADASPRTLATVARLLVTTESAPELITKLDRLLPDA